MNRQFVLTVLFLVSFSSGFVGCPDTEQGPEPPQTVVDVAVAPDDLSAKLDAPNDGDDGDVGVDVLERDLSAADLPTETGDDAPLPGPCVGITCGENEQCDDGVCVCADGYSSGGESTCVDVDECATSNGGCDSEAHCVNVPGSFVCICTAPYTGDGFSCWLDPTTLTYNGLHGYIGSSSGPTPPEYRYGASFYSAAWRLTPEPLKNFQIGLPGTWFTPDNTDNTTTALCPPGTMAGDNWPERAPTYATVFQTMEGGLGYWAGNQYRYGPPKFSMNATADCYTNQIASPGWRFFAGGGPLPDDGLGIAQLSNRMLIPPDGLPFAGQPQGELVGYGFIALPLTDPRPDPQPTGEQSWTLFLNSANFKGPLAYYLPETWSKISKDYPFDEGRGLDSRPIRDGLGGNMEINTVQQFQAVADDGTLYTKVPQLQFPVDESGRTVLVRDLMFYSKGALYDDVLAWRDGGGAPSGQIDSADTFRPSVGTFPVTYRQDDIVINGINAVATPTVFEGDVFGLQWSGPSSDGMALFPRYFKHVGGQRVAISEQEVPPETFLSGKEFPTPTTTGNPYSVQPLNGAWSAPGPASGPHTAELGDCSAVTYHWYRFIDQPVFQQYPWTVEEKAALQGLVEKMHQAWTPDKTYLPPPTGGELAGFDAALMVTPPPGFEVGYVPIVTHQEASTATGCPADLLDQKNAAAKAVLEGLKPEDLVGSYQRLPVENPWHEVQITLDASGQLWWENAAQVTWKLFLESGVLTTGEDCPYGVNTLGIALLEDAQGAVYGIPKRIDFGEGYHRIWSSLP